MMDFSTALETKVEAETMSGKQNLDSEKMILYDSLKEDFEEKIRRLEEDRHNLVTSDLWHVSVGLSVACVLCVSISLCRH